MALHILKIIFNQEVVVMVQYILQHWYFHIFLVLQNCSKYGSH